MRLTYEQIHRISASIVSNLKKKKLVRFKAEEKTVLQRIEELFSGDIEAEVNLDDKVNALMRKYEKDIESGRMDYKKMFALIKSKLAKEKGIIL